MLLISMLTAWLNIIMVKWLVGKVVDWYVELLYLSYGRLVFKCLRIRWFIRYRLVLKEVG